MSTKKITALTELSAAAAATDMLPVVDVSDTTDAATGTTKKITATNICKGVGIGAGNTTAEPVKINTSNGRVGIGLTSPTSTFHVQGTSSGIFLSHSDGTDSAKLGQDSSGNGAAYVNNAAGNIMVQFDSNGDSYVKTNFGIGGTSFGTNADNVLAIANGTIPASSPADAVQLYAQDVSTSELKVRDEAGNISTLSPHNFDLLGGRSEQMAWSYASKNVFIGKEVAVDMMKVIRALEKLTGESYVTIKDLKKSEVLDWDTEEKKKESERKAEIADAKSKGLPEPDTYTKKSKPSWMS